jgi:hypothetical protein
MRTFSCALGIVAAAAFSRPAFAKPWNGITPGSSTKVDVVKRFGEPTKKVSEKGKEVVAYIGEQAIKGTTQTQFTLNASGVVEQIVVFPSSQVDKATVEDNFGPPCSGAPASAAACYTKKLTDDYRTYFWYKRLGLVIFFTEDGKSVYSFMYNAPGAGEKAAE